MSEDDYPFRVYAVEDLVKGFLKFRSELKKFTPTLNLPRKFTGMMCADAFFQYERMATGGEGKKSPVEAWKDEKIRNHVKKQALRIHRQRLQDATRLFLPMMCKQFHPFLAGVVYKYFDTKAVFDPYAGWGDRCVAAMAYGVPYTGVDSNPNLGVVYKKMIEFYREHTTSKVTFIGDRSENVDIEAIDFDLVLSSPPFWKTAKRKMIEMYKGAETDYNKFMSNSMIPVMKRCLKKAKWFCLYIPSDMYDDLVKVFGPSQQNFVFAAQSSKIHTQVQNRFIYAWKGV